MRRATIGWSIWLGRSSRESKGDVAHIDKSYSLKQRGKGAPKKKKAPASKKGKSYHCVVEARAVTDGRSRSPTEEETLRASTRQGDCTTPVKYVEETQYTLEFGRISVSKVTCSGLK